MFSSLSIKECRSSIGGGGGRAGRRTARRRSLPLQTTNAAFATFTTVAYFSSFSVKWRRGSSGGGRDGRRAARRRSLPLRITTTTTTLTTPTTVAPPPLLSPLLSAAAAATPANHRSPVLLLPRRPWPSLARHYPYRRLHAWSRFVNTALRL
jgi:hypothetical protein